MRSNDDLLPSCLLWGDELRQDARAMKTILLFTIYRAWGNRFTRMFSMLLNNLCGEDQNIFAVVFDLREDSTEHYSCGG